MSAPMLPASPSLERGQRLLLAYVTTHQWFHRRVEHISIASDVDVRRRVSADVTLSTREPPQGEPFDSSHDVIPLTFLVKRPLVRFDLCDAGGQPIPLLTTSQNGLLAWEMLVAAASLDLAGRELPRNIQRSLWRIVHAPHDDAIGWLRVFGEIDLSRQLRRSLLKDELFLDLAEELARNFMLLVRVPWAPGDRTILKFAYQDAVVPPPRGLAPPLGWVPTRLEFQLRMLWYAASYHIEFETPPGLAAVAGAVVDRTGDIVPSRHTRAGSRLHVHVTRGHDEDARAIVDVSVTKRGFLRTATLTSWGTVLLVLFMARRASDINTAAQNLDAVSAMLALLPTAASAYLVRPGEHGLASSLLFSARTAVVVVGAAAAAAAAAVASGVGGDTLTTSLYAAAVVASVAAFVLSVALLRSPSK